MVKSEVSHNQTGPPFICHMSSGRSPLLPRHPHRQDGRREQVWLEEHFLSVGYDHFLGKIAPQASMSAAAQPSAEPRLLSSGWSCLPTPAAPSRSLLPTTSSGLFSASPTSDRRRRLREPTDPAICPFHSRAVNTPLA